VIVQNAKIKRSSKLKTVQGNEWHKKKLAVWEFQRPALPIDKAAKRTEGTALKVFSTLYGSLLRQDWRRVLFTCLGMTFESSVKFLSLFNRWGVEKKRAYTMAEGLFFEKN